MTSQANGHDPFDDILYDWNQIKQTAAALKNRDISLAIVCPSEQVASSDATIPISHAEEIDRVACLPSLQYDQERKSVAKRLGVRPTTLDQARKQAINARHNRQPRDGSISLPDVEPWDSPVCGADLLDEMVATLRNYLVLPSGAAELIALWVVHTHAIDCFNITPRLAVISPEKGCGKTTLLDIIRCLVARPLPTTNISSASVFRLTDLYQPTILIDEGDTFLNRNEELRSLVNAGHRRNNAYVYRVLGENYDDLRRFSTWAAIAIAMIGKPPDTIEDRSVIVLLVRKKPTEEVATFRFDRVADIERLGRQAARWALDSAKALKSCDPETHGLFNRLADNWRPLLGIAST